MTISQTYSHLGPVTWWRNFRTGLLYRLCNFKILWTLCHCRRGSTNVLGRDDNELYKPDPCTYTEQEPSIPQLFRASIQAQVWNSVACFMSLLSPETQWTFLVVSEWVSRAKYIRKSLEEMRGTRTGFHGICVEYSSGFFTRWKKAAHW